MGCVLAKKAKHPPGIYEDPTILASETSWRVTNLLEDFGQQVTVNEVEALYELFKKLSCSKFKVGYIHKEEFQLALLRSSQRHNFFADRIFDLFDINHNGVIEFGEFVRSLNVFHPNTSEAEKIAFAFKLYDLRQVGYIKREELKEMVLAILNELELSLSDDVVDTIVYQAFIQADLNQDGKIDTEEWKEFIAQNPSLIKKMTLPYLKDVTMAFPSFIVNSKVENIEMNI